MKKLSIIRVISFNLQTYTRWRPAFLFGLFFVLEAWKIAADFTSSIKSIGDFYFLFFSGPGNGSLSLIEILVWFIPQMLFYFLIGDIAYDELSQRGSVLLPILGSRWGWWSGKVLTLFVFSLIYVSGLILTITLGLIFANPTHINSFNSSVTLTSLWPNSQDFSGGQLILLIALLYISSMFALGCIQMTFSLFCRRSIYGFLLIIGILLVSCFISVNPPWLVRWLPGTQTMLVRHTFIDVTIPDFSFLWSILYNATLVAVSLIIGFWAVKRLDITGFHSKS